MPRIALLENLHEAFLRAARGKASRQAVVLFRRHLDANLADMSRRLLDGSFPFGRYHFFTIYDPKERTICAAPFPERVAFHAIMRICHPVFDNFQTPDSYASRKGRGQYAALARTQQLVRRYEWYAKLDVCKYFDSISHEVLKGQLGRLFKDRRLTDIFRQLIDGYEVAPGCGLPIGNLTSQYFANHYLAVADHHAKEHLQVAAMVRYMDDTLLFAHSKEQLLRQVQQYIAYARDELRLQLHPPVVNATRQGIPFLGYVVGPHRMRLNGRSLRRFRHKMCRLSYDLDSGRIDLDTYLTHASCLRAFAEKADVTWLAKGRKQIPGMNP